MKFTRVVLPNGLTVLHEYRGVPVSSFMIVSKFGAAYETESEKGISHFLEHMCFKGTERRKAGEISGEIEKVGGELNAATGNDKTYYYIKLPSQNSTLALDVLTDLYFKSVFPEGEIEKEAKVVCEEIKRKEDTPVPYVLKQISSNLYSAPFSVGTLGTNESVLSMKREDLIKKQRENYTPSNSILCVVGNTPFKDVLSFLETFSFPENSLSSTYSNITRLNSRSSETRTSLKQAALAMGFHFPSAISPNNPAAEIFNTYLGDGMSSRLFLEVREKLGLAYSIGSFYSSGAGFGHLVAHAGTDKDNVSKTMDIILREIRAARDVSSEKLASIKRQMIGSCLVKTEDSSNSALELVNAEIYGNAEDYYKFPEKLNSVSLDEVRALSVVGDYSSFVLGPN